MSNEQIDDLLGELNERLFSIYDSQFCGGLYQQSGLYKRIKDAQQALRNRKPVTIKSLEEKGILPPT